MSLKERLLKIKEEKGQIHLRFLPELEQEVLDMTGFLNHRNPSNAERLFCIYNDIIKVPICPECGKEVKFNKTEYKTFCSLKCSNNNSNKQEKSKQTLIKKYGVDNPMKNSEIKEKSKQSLLNTINKNNNEIQSKRKQTCMDKYGVDHAMKNNKIKEKSKQTCMDKYGVDNPMKLEINKTKISNSLGDFKGSILNNKNRKDFLERVTPLFNIEEATTIKYTNYKYRCNYCNNEFIDWVDSTYKFIPRCPNCFPKSISQDEVELRNYIEDIYDGEIIYSDRSILNGKELDIYFPSLKIAIEFNGLYWHRHQHKKDKNYHLNKTLICKENGIQLIHIFSDEWYNKKELIKNKLKYILKQSNNERIYARNCFINEISSELKNKFLDKYHIQGKDTSSINLGLFTKSPKSGKIILVSVMTFCKPRVSLGQKDSIYDYELSRFASTYNYIINGAFSKLFSYFKNNYEWSKILTYADLRWSQGNVYEKNNWTYLRRSQPNYWYFHLNKTSKRYHRFTFTKQKITKLFDIKDSSLTEYDIMLQNGYDKIYDCGNYVFEYNR